MKASSLDVAARLLALSVLLVLLLACCVTAQREEEESAKNLAELLLHTGRTVDADAADDCSSLTGPFCPHTGSMTFFAAYMTPISPLDLQHEDNQVSRRSGKSDERATKRPGRKCFFQHFSSSWMDSGGDANDLMNQQVASVDECEQLCCEHAECQSFTFWRGRTCFLRATSKTPRQDGDAFSGIRLI